jgi:tRNA 2-thiocytidine biosynthesis protein TtcA
MSIPTKQIDHYAQLCRLVGRAVHDFEMIKAGDRLLVGISGGVDSMMLMHLLQRLQQRAPVQFDLLAVTIDEGFTGINHALLNDYAREQGWDYQIIQVPIAQLIQEKQLQHKPCGLCARLRRGYIHNYADQLNCNKLVLGHHRDDLCVSLLMSLFRGTGLKTMGPNVPCDQGTKRLLRPLCYAPKELIETAARSFEFPDTGACDYTDQLDETGDRAYLERQLKQLQHHFPDIGKNMLNSMADLRPDYLLDPRFRATPPNQENPV